MEPVEQVILYIRSTGRMRTVEAVNTTERVRSSDIPELIGWFDQEGTETVLYFDTSNLFFHPLPSGDYAVGIVFPPWDNSFFVRVLIVPSTTLLKFANNPISLYRELAQRQQIPPLSHPPRRVHPLKVSQGAPPFDRQAVLKVVNRLGTEAVARLVRSLQDSLSTFFTSSMEAADVIDAALNLFPIHFRTELTFATEPFFSDLTPLRLVGVGGNRRQIVKRTKILFELDAIESQPTQHKDKQESNDDFRLRLVNDVLRTGNFDLFESYLKNEALQSFADDFGKIPSVGEPEPVIPLRADIAETPRQRELLAQIDAALTRVLLGDGDAIPPLQNAWQELQQLLPWDEQDRLREKFIANIHSVSVKRDEQPSSRTPCQSVGLLDLLLVFLGREQR